LKRDSTKQQRREIQIAARLAELRELARRMTEGFIRAQHSLGWPNERMRDEMEPHAILEVYRLKK
jgi:hypothetical protein